MLTLISVVGWLLIGMVAGTLIRPRHPGPESLGRLATMFVGIAGAFLGGVAAAFLGFDITATHPAGWIMSGSGAVATLSVPAFVGRALSTA